MIENEIQVLGTSHKKKNRFRPVWWSIVVVIAVVITALAI